MGFKEVSSLDADVVIALGKKDKSTGKPYPKQAEGYFLGSRQVENKRGTSSLHFLQTAKGNLGIWGTTDLNRKLSQVTPGSMVRITSTGTKPTPNGDMYTYKVEIDSENSIEVSAATAEVSDGADETEDTAFDDDGESTAYESDDGVEDSAVMVAQQAERKAKVQALFNKGKKA